MPITAAIYARVSTEIQAEHGFSLETQIDGCMKLAKELGAESIQKYVDDGYSGAFLERPALERLRDALQAKTYDIVICYVPDRLARRLSHQLLLTEEVERSGASLHFVREEYKSTPEGRMMYQMQGVFSEYEREKIKERTMRGIRGKLRSGHPVKDARVLGYDFIKETSEYVINPAEAETVRLIFRLYTEELDGGAWAVAKKLIEMKVPTKKGSLSWRDTVVFKVLRRQMYTGTYYANRYGQTKTESNKRVFFERPESEWIEMHCPQIIDERTFSIAQAKLERNRINRRQREDNFSLLHGLLHCGICGRHMLIIYAADYRYYVCTMRTQRFVLEKRNKCDSLYCSVDQTDDAFLELMQQICKSEKTLSAYIAQTRENRPKTVQNKLADVIRRRDKIKADKAAVMEWYSAGYISRDAATEKLAELKNAEERIESLMDSSDKEEPPLDVNTIFSAVSNAKATKSGLRKILPQILRAVYVYREGKRNKSVYHFRLEFL